MSNWPALEGMTVLLVEDESLVSMLAEDMLEQAGCTVVLAMRLAQALELATSETFDLAILDVNLGSGDTSYPVADALVDRDIPFFFATGYGAAGVEPPFQNRLVVQKPYTADQLLGTASRSLAG